VPITTKTPCSPLLSDTLAGTKFSPTLNPNTPNENNNNKRIGEIISRNVGEVLPLNYSVDGDILCNVQRGHGTSLSTRPCATHRYFALHDRRRRAISLRLRRLMNRFFRNLRLCFVRIYRRDGRRNVRFVRTIFLTKETE